MTFRDRLQRFIEPIDVKVRALHRAVDRRSTAQMNLDEALPLKPETPAEKRERDERQTAFDKYWKEMFPYERSSDPVFRRRERRILQMKLSTDEERERLATLWQIEHPNHGAFERALWHADRQSAPDDNGETPVLKRALDFQKKIGDAAHRKDYGILADRNIYSERKHNHRSYRAMTQSFLTGGVTVPEDPRAFTRELRSRIVRIGVIEGIRSARNLAWKMGMSLTKSDKAIIAEINPDDDFLYDRGAERTDRSSATLNREIGDRGGALRDAARRIATSLSRKSKVSERGGEIEP